MLKFIRRVKTTHEIRAAAAAKADGVKIRGARSVAQLPTFYTDIGRSRRGRDDRYKNHRRKSA